MMIVLESFSDEKKVPNECILRVITGVVVSIPILVTTPIDESSVKRSHQEMGGKQKEEPGVWSKRPVDADVGRTEG